MSAVERFNGGQLDTSSAVDREFAALRRQAAVLARSGLLPKSITHVGKTERKTEEVESVVLAIGLGAQSLGLPLNVLTISKFDVLEGVVEPRVQLMVAAATAKGHELWPIEADDEKAVVGACRAGSNRESRFTFTRRMARDAGLLDEWVVRWVANNNGQGSHPEKVTVVRDGEPSAGLPEWAKKMVAAGQTQRKDNWHTYTADQLLKSAFKRAVKWTMGDAVLGIDGIAVPPSPDLPPRPLEEATEADDYAEAEVVEPNRTSAPEAEATVPDKWVRSIAIECSRKGLTRDQRLNLICKAIGRDVASSKDVLASEAALVVEAVQAVPEPEDLEYAPGEEPY